MNTLPQVQPCCLPSCDETTIVQVPGPAGDDGADGAAGAAGVNAYTTTTANFTMPAEAGTVTVSVANSTWIGLNQILYIQSAGYMKATALPTSASVTLQNLESTGSGTYTDNVAPATVISSGVKVCPSGLQGPSGAGAAGQLLAANNLSDVASAATSRTNLGLGTMATQAAGTVAITGGTVVGITDLAVADGGTGASTAAAARTNLGLVIGTDVQAFHANLTSVASGLTAAGLALIDDADAAAQRATLGVLPREGLLGSLIGADFNSTADQAITIASGVTKYVIRRIVVTNASISLTTAAGGVYGAASKSAPVIVAAAQVYSALTASTKFKDLTLEAVAGTDIFTQATLYLSLSTAQGSAATASVFIFGDNLT